MSMGRAVGFLLLFALFGTLVPGPAFARDRVERIAGWRVASGGTGDGGRLVSLSRRGRGYAFEHYLEFWRGNGGVVIGASFRNGDCRSGDASAIVPFEQGMGRETFDERLADYLRACPLPLAEADAFRRSLDAVWPRFAALAERARAAMEAENEAIARHGETD